jgi:hypothetical protein
MGERDRRFTSKHGGTAFLDAATGLLWEAMPAPVPTRWHDAVASAWADGWRLPTATELMALFSGLPELSPFPPPRVGDVFWSVSESPFAPTSCVRVVEVGDGRQPAVLLRDKAALARPWRVRDLARS